MSPALCGTYVQMARRTAIARLHPAGRKRIIPDGRAARGAVNVPAGTKLNRGRIMTERAGQLVRSGACEGEPDEPLKQQAAQLCRKAGAEPGAIPA